MKEFKELREGIYQLKPLNNKGEYANINLNSGMLLYSRRTSNILPAQSKISIPEFEHILAEDRKTWLGKEFIDFRNSHTEEYNSYVDRLNRMEIQF